MRQILKETIIQYGGQYGKDIVEDCLNYIDSQIILACEDPSIIDLDLFYSINKKQPTVLSNDLISLIIKMKEAARERSHGAVILDRAFISNENYQKLIKEFKITDTSTVTVGRVIIKPSDKLAKIATAVGIGKPKFSCVSPELLVIFGNTT